MTIKEKRREILAECKIYTDSPKERLGGQQCGMPQYPTVVEHENLGIKISINLHRGMHKNREKALMLMELALLDIIN